MKYKVLKPVAWSGRREKGEVIEMLPEEAENIGLEYLTPVEDESIGEEKKDEPSAPKEGAPESESRDNGTEKVEDEAAVKPRGGRGKNKK